VLSRGDHVAGAYLVVIGRPRVYTVSEAGREATLYTIDPGETCVLAIEDVHTHALDRRLATFLVVRASSSGELRMTQQAIANHLGTTQEVVARLLAAFSQLRFASRQRGMIVVHNPARLSRWATASDHSRGV
jgi:CRP-like cAMP-binding protein